MRKLFFTVVLVMFSLVTFGQQWIAIESDTPSSYRTELVSSSEDNITVNLQVSGFFLNPVVTLHGEAQVVALPKAVSTVAAGEPDLPMIPIPTIIGDRALMRLDVVRAEYTDYENIEIAPSKGDFPRSIDPDDVPYTYGEAYTTDAFFPSTIATLDEPYIHRDVRGQNMMVVPFQYNPVTKVLRVYNRLVLSMVKEGNDSRNIIESRTRSFKLDPEFKKMYESRYINYSESMSKYTAIEDAGELLIICYDGFMAAMEPFVAWKKQIGRPTTMVGTSTTGTTAEAIKSYITNYYNAHPNVTDVLLVGDVAQIPGVYISAGSGYSGYSGYGDAPYGQTAGNDYYNELIVGRFCCENVMQVTNHINKVINYERDLNATATWLPIGQGVSKNEGAGSGHYGESDYQHIDLIRDDLLNYNYTTVHRDYQNVSGVSSSANIVSQHINEGVSIINYCNHGSETSWGVFNYSNSNVNALTNDFKLPYIISVACLNGKYDHSGNCFAEAWMRATNNTTGNPTGAIGGMFSYISQPWTPPQYGQDEMVDILVESYSDNIKRTMGGVSINGNMSILDLGASSNPNKGTYNTWILFGDPTLTLRNAIPQDMGVTHATTMNTTANNFVVNATNGDGALATLTINGEILGSATITNGIANITFDAPDAIGTATLTVFGYNKITYISTIEIVGGSVTQYNINVSANPEEGGVVMGGGTYNQNQSCTVTAIAATGYDFTNWTEDDNVVSTNASYTFNVTANRNLVANFSVQPQNYTVNVSANPTEGGTVTGGGEYLEGLLCTVRAIANTNYTFANWTENGTVVSDIATYTFTVDADRNLVANFTYTPNYFTITVSANPTDGGFVTDGGSYIEGQSCTVIASANEGYVFVNWTENGNVVSNQASYTFIVTSDRNLVANFQVLSFTINVAIEPLNGGTVIGSGTYNYGESCTLSAAPAAFHSFVSWTERDVVVSTDANYTFTVTGNRDLVANFIYIPQIYTIALSANPTEGGTVRGGGSYEEDQTCTVSALPAEGYKFINWTEHDQEVSTDAHYTFIVTDNRDLVANFELQTFEIRVWVDPAEAASVTGDGTYHYGDEVTLTLNRNEDWSFLNWTEDDEVVSEETIYIFTATRDRNLKAHFLYTESIGENSVSAKVYPNPTNDKVTIECQDLSHVRIVNTFGQMVYNADHEGEQAIIDLSQTAKGIYMMYIEANGGQIVKKIVVE